MSFIHELRPVTGAMLYVMGSAGAVELTVTPHAIVENGTESGNFYPLLLSLLTEKPKAFFEWRLHDFLSSLHIAIMIFFPSKNTAVMIAP